MLLMLAGSILAALGLFAGAVLVAAPLGLVGWAPGVALWVLFPVLSVVGVALLAAVATGEAVRRWLLVLSSLLLVLALGAAAGLVAIAASLVGSAYGTASLWFVLIIAGGLGVTGAASHHKSSRLPQAAA